MPGWRKHSWTPKPTSDVPTAFFNATSAGVVTKPVEFEVHNGAPDAIRKAVSHTSNTTPAHRWIGVRDRAPPDWSEGSRRLRTSIVPTTARPTMVAMAGHTKLSLRIVASAGGR
jgi:hypothetical protein